MCKHGMASYLRALRCALTCHVLRPWRAAFARYKPLRYLSDVLLTTVLNLAQLNSKTQSKCKASVQNTDNKYVRFNSFEARIRTSSSMKSFLFLALVASLALGIPTAPPMFSSSSSAAIDLSSAVDVSPAEDFTAQSAGYAHGYCSCTSALPPYYSPLLTHPQSPSNSCSNASPRHPRPGTPRPSATCSASRTIPA
jgi:hypothetical protein